MTRTFCRTVSPTALCPAVPSPRLCASMRSTQSPGWTSPATLEEASTPIETARMPGARAAARKPGVPGDTKPVGTSGSPASNVRRATAPSSAASAPGRRVMAAEGTCSAGNDCQRRSLLRSNVPGRRARAATSTEVCASAAEAGVSAGVLCRSHRTASTAPASSAVIPTANRRLRTCITGHRSGSGSWRRRKWQRHRAWVHSHACAPSRSERCGRNCLPGAKPRPAPRNGVEPAMPRRGRRG